MPSTQSYLDYCIEQLSPIEVARRKMMGEYLLYSQGVLWGGIYDDRLLVKQTPGNAFLGLAEETPYPGAKPMWRLDVDDRDNLVACVERAIADLSNL